MPVDRARVHPLPFARGCWIVFLTLVTGLIVAVYLRQRHNRAVSLAYVTAATKAENDFQTGMRRWRVEEAAAGGSILDVGFADGKLLRRSRQELLDYLFPSGVPQPVRSRSGESSYPDPAR